MSIRYQHVGESGSNITLDNNADKNSEFNRLMEYYVNQAVGARGEEGDNNQESSIVKIIDIILDHAIRHQASDVHIEPQTDSTVIRFRVDGILKEMIILPKDLHQAILTRIRIMTNLRIDEMRIPQDGRFQYHMDARAINIRVSIIPTLHGNKVVFRLLEDRSAEFNLGSLGLSACQQAVVKNNIQRPHGLILVTGPTSSGKTTTLYSLISLLNNQGLNITTIEDPIEYGIKGVSQIQNNPMVNLNFATGLRAILRQDPNVIMVGEIRDKETAALAVNAAMTGHLVLSSLHTNNAAAAIPRLLEMGVEPFVLASTINLVIAQRLARKICAHCAVADPMVGMELSKIKGFGNTNKENAHQGKRGEGCVNCFQTGHKGRVGIFEILPVSNTIRRLIQKRSSTLEIKQAAQREGATDLYKEGLKKIQTGETTLLELKRVIEESEFESE